MIKRFSEFIVFDLFKLSPESNLGNILEFFIYDVVKIIILLYVMITVIGFFRTFISENKVKEWVKGKGIFANIVVAMLGAFTPFCSCSSIPLFLSFVRVGMPLGVTFSFLITSPIINEYLIVLMVGFFGWKIAASYFLSGITIGVVSGVILGKLGLEKYIMSDRDVRCCGKEKKYDSLWDRIKFGKSEADSIVRRIFVWILMGVGLGALIHNYVPSEAIKSFVGRAGVFAVPLAVLLGVPMYGSCAAIVPIAMVLFQKGMPLGTALSFMMAISALSLPEAVILKQVLRAKLVIIFFAVTTVGIIVTGYIFNFLENIVY